MAGLRDPKIRDFPDRIADRLEIDLETGCWIWSGLMVRGMPYFSWDGHAQLGNRVAYQEFVGPIPPKARVRHHCASLLCMNPDHLYLDDQSTPEGKRAAFLAFVTPRINVLDNGCWDWTGTRTKWGYGFVKNTDGNPSNRLHRIIYEMVCGRVPDGLVLDHTCHNDKDCDLNTKCPHRRCCNPAHMEAVPNEVNILRGQSPAAKKKRQTHCQFGHEFTEENTYLRPGKTDRECRVCKRDRGVREARQRKERRWAAKGVIPSVA